LRKRYYLIFVARDADGQLLKVPIPLHYLYIFVAGAVIGMFTVTGMAGSYARMLTKVARFNELRTEKDTLTKNYNTLEKVSKEKEIQVASLSSLAGEVSALYGLKAEHVSMAAVDDSASLRYKTSIDQLQDLRTVAMTGAASLGLELGANLGATTHDLYRLTAAPTLWPVLGRITASFGERADPFNRDEGEFHTGVDIAAPAGSPIHATGDGIVHTAQAENGYGNAVVIDHGYGFQTLYGHMSSFIVTAGQHVDKGQVIGYVGVTGRTTGPHVHYEIRINNTPINPHKYLEASLVGGDTAGLAGGF